MKKNGYFPLALGAHGNKIALHCQKNGEITYADLENRANALSAQLGNSKKLVFIKASNNVPTMISYLGALAGGHAVHLLDPDRNEDNKALIKNYNPHFVIDTASDKPEISTISEERTAIHPELAILLSTSGSTGSQKLVKISKENIQSNTDAIIQYLNLNENDITITSLKPFYSFGLSVINTHLAAGAKIVLCDTPVHDPAFWELFRALNATNFSGVPHSYTLIETLNPDFSSFKSLRFMTQAGGKMAPAIVKKYAQMALGQGWKFFVMYGQTEASPRMSYLPPHLAVAYPDSIGIPIPGGKLYLIDDHGNKITSENTPGEMVYEGPNVMVGYAENAEDLSNKEILRALHTGDLAILLDHGLFKIVGRIKRFAKIFGLRINLDDVEAHIHALGLPGHVVATDKIIFICHTTQAADSDLASKLAEKYQIPASVFQFRCLETLPLLPNGKLDYRTLQHICMTQTKNTILHFILKFLGEVKAIVLGGANHWSSVEEIYAMCFSKKISPEESFISLKGDSLIFVELSLCLEEYLGFLPAEWEHKTIRELENFSGANHG